MLERVLEPEVMDTQAEAITYDDMDHSEVNARFVEDLLAAGNLAGEVLDMGTGTARIPLLLCDKLEAVRVLAVDLSPSMLDVARVNIELSPHVDRIMLDCVDAKKLPFEDDRFDVVISNSIIHHIPDPADALAEAVRVCKQGGMLFFRDLLRPASEEELQRLVQTHAGDESDHARKMFSDSLRAALTCEEMRGIAKSSGLDATDASRQGDRIDLVQVTSDRHWTLCARKSC